eukprot:229520-Alexandrium_andersonii.AAC.1
MSASLVGSEMCIRDSSRLRERSPFGLAGASGARAQGPFWPAGRVGRPGGCLLYTSDAADDM